VLTVTPDGQIWAKKGRLLDPLGTGSRKLTCSRTRETFRTERHKSNVCCVGLEARESVV